MKVRHNDVPGATTKSSILFLRVEGFFYLWQNVGRFSVILCHGLHKENKIRVFERVGKDYDPKRNIPDNQG